MGIKNAFAAIVTSLCIATTLAGCGGSTEDDARPPASPTGEAATGPEITAKNYSYHAPDGWADPPQRPPGFDFDSLAAEKDPGDDAFSNNVNVLRVDTKIDSVDELEEQAVKELETGGFTDLKVKDRVSIDGADGIHLSGGASMNKLEYVVEQFGILHDGSLYFVTFSFTPDVKVATREKVADSVLTTWQWKD